MLKINAIRDNNSLKQNFKSNKQQNKKVYTEEDLNKMYKSGEKAGFMNGASLAILSAILCIGSAIAHKKITQYEQEKFMNKVFKFYNTKDINKDSFTITDVNKDGTPDILIDKKNSKDSYVIDFQDVSIKEISQKEKKELGIE